MEAQEIFNTVVNHLRIQGHPCVDENGGCVYRLETSHDSFERCAVGVLIGDDEYDKRMEGLDPEGLLTESLLPERLIQHAEFLKDLQEIHDNWAGSNVRDPEWLESRFQNFAKRRNLTYTPPEAAPQITALTGVKAKEMV